MAPTSGMAMVTAWRDGVDDGSGKAMVTVRWGWRRRDVETEGGVDDGDVDSVALREAAAQRAGNLGSLMAQ
jgi:hypothetical protein